MNITDPLFDLAKRHPQGDAIIALGGTLTYADLARAVSSTAARFRKEGLAPGDVAAISLPHQLQLLVASLALAHLGVGQIVFHASDPPELLRDLAKRLRLAAVIARRGTTGTDTGIGRLDPPPDATQQLKGLEALAPQASVGGAAPYFFKRTAGTTGGAPKVMMLDHNRALKGRAAFAGAVPRGPGTRFLSITHLGFAGAIGSAVSCLTSGGTLAVPDGIATAGALVEFIERHRVNNVAGSPVHAARLLAVARDDAPLLPGVQVFRMSSTVVPDALRAEILARITPNLYILYGITEAGPVTVAPPELVRRIPGVVGHPQEGVEVRLVNDAGLPAAPSERGKVCVRSAGMSDGYLDDPEETARCFRDGWFLSGDVAEMTSEGVLVHHGRGDDTMILDGLNVQPAEIESRLLSHPAVAEAAAFSIKSVSRGDIPLAAVVLKAGATEADLLKFCRGSLGPRSPLRVLAVAALPRNAAGKVLRGELARLVADRG